MKAKMMMGISLLMAGIISVCIAVHAQQPENAAAPAEFVEPAAVDEAPVQPVEQPVVVVAPVAEINAETVVVMPPAEAPAAPVEQPAETVATAEQATLAIPDAAMVPAAPIEAAPVVPVADEAPVTAVEAATGDTTPTAEANAVQPSPEKSAEALLEIPADNDPVRGALATVNTTNAELISITLDDVDMIDVVRMFTRISGANIITSPSNLLGKVSVNLTDVEWRPALESILDMNTLSLVEKTPGSKVYSIVPKDLTKQDPLVVETFFLKYASVSNVNQVVSSMKDARGTISTFPARNALVIRSTSANMAEMRQIIERIDKLRDQVFIEAKFMELNDDAIKDLGINWQVLQAYNVSAGNMKIDYNDTKNWDKSNVRAQNKFNDRSRNDTMNQRYDINGVQYEETTTEFQESPPDSGFYTETTTITPTRTVTDTIASGDRISSDVSDAFTRQVADVRTAILGIDDFKLTLSMLKQMNGVSIVSNPKIIVANEEPATIHIGQTERPFVSSITPGQQGIAPVVTYNPGEPVELGVKLTVTPTVNTESNITVRIQPELTRFLENAVAPNGQTYPIVGTKRITTVFCLESGKTVAIGGLTETEDRDRTTKIPLLGDIPLIGKYLFSHTHKEKNQQETIIFVTVGLALPDTMDRDVGLPEDTELTRRQVLESEARRQEFNADFEKARQAREAQMQKNIQKSKNRLLKKND